MIEATYTAICDYCGEELSPYYTEMEAKRSILELGWEIEPDGVLNCGGWGADEDEDEDEE